MSLSSSPLPSHAVLAIIGGGPAGLCTALFLSDAAPELTDRIVVLERDAYPRDKFCAGGVGARADRLLASIGVTVDVPSAPVDGVSLTLAHGDLIDRTGGIGRVVRRLEFDHELARMAARRGIVVRDGTKVERVVVQPSRVHVETSRGSFTADAVVGADGVGSVVRRCLGLPAGRLRAQVIELDTEPVTSDRSRDLLHFDGSDRAVCGYAWDFPTLVDGRPLVCRGIYELRYDDRSRRTLDLRARLGQRLAAMGLDIGRYRLKRFAERGFEPHQPVSFPRALLVGEAAGIDPLTGEGIAQAVQYGERAGRFLAASLRSGDLGFAGWSRYFARSTPGRDLALRVHLARHYYFGRRRAAMDRFLLDHPRLFTLGMDHFAGRPLPRLALLQLGVAAAWRALVPAV